MCGHVSVGQSLCPSIWSKRKACKNFCRWAYANTQHGGVARTQAFLEAQNKTRAIAHIQGRRSGKPAIILAMLRPSTMRKHRQKGASSQVVPHSIQTVPYGIGKLAGYCDFCPRPLTGLAEFDSEACAWEKGQGFVCVFGKKSGADVEGQPRLGLWLPRLLRGIGLLRVIRRLQAKEKQLFLCS